VVTTPEELAVRETIELCAELTGSLRLPVAPPIVNAVPGRRFTAADEARLAEPDLAGVRHPHLEAARFQIARRAEARAQLATLRAALGTDLIRLPFLYEGPEAPGGVAELAAVLADAADLPA
jgi:hypothetical protein